MLSGQKIIIVFPGYNVERTLERTLRGIPPGIADDVILVDDGSQDRTAALAAHLGIPCYRHAVNAGYGAAQKTGYQAALERGADIVVMLHPDDQYPAELVPALASLVASGLFHVALGSRLLGTGAIRRGMPRYKYVFNRLWTAGQNACLGQHLSEYHTGFRAFSREFLLRAPLLENSDDFLFDNQLLVQAVYFGYAIGELSAPARFTADASSMSPQRGIRYGVGIIWTTGQYLLQRTGVMRSPLFDLSSRRLSGVGQSGIQSPIEPLSQPTTRPLPLN